MDIYHIALDNPFRTSPGFFDFLQEGLVMMNKNEDHTVCYCFNYTTEDIIMDVVTNQAHSSILERIMKEKKAGNCRCSEKNPKGR